MRVARAELDGKVTAVVLAGGEARRMDGSKPLRAFGDITLLDHALGQARRWTDHVLVSVRSPDQAGNISAPLLLDVPGVRGPLSGLLAAADSGRPFVLTIPCDMPFLPENLLERLFTAIDGHNAAIASCGGHLQPVCALWRTASLTQIPSYANLGRLSIAGFAETVGYAIVEWEEEGFANLNTLEDLATARRSRA